jgi:polysaccharide export outer membrane protein
MTQLQKAMKFTLNFVLKSAIVFFSIMITLLLFSSCNKNVLYKHNSSVSNNTSANATADGNSNPTLKPDDKITISVWEHEELSVGSVHTVYNVAEESGKWLLIDANGEVQLPMIGKIKLGELTVSEATDKLRKEYGKTIQNPIVNIKVLNNQITILGEVQKPGLYVFSTDNVKLTDVVGRASGFTDYAKTRSIKVIRGKEAFIIDLTNIAFNETKVLPGDVVYIPPAGSKKFDRLASKLIPIASLLTALALVYSVSANN